MTNILAQLVTTGAKHDVHVPDECKVSCANTSSCQAALSFQHPQHVDRSIQAGLVLTAGGRAAAAGRTAAAAASGQAAPSA